MLFRDRAEFFVTQYALTRRSTKHEHLKSFISSHSFFQLLYSNPEVENEFMKGAWGRFGICPHQWGSIWWRWHWGLSFSQHDLFILFNCIIWSPYSVDQFSLNRLWTAIWYGGASPSTMQTSTARWHWLYFLLCILYLSIHWIGLDLYL